MKKKLKNKKIYAVVAGLFLAAVLATFLIILFLSGQGTVSKALSLGDKYLSDMDYDSAIREYSNVLSIDPMNRKAMTGLVLSYAGKGDHEMVKQIVTTDLSDTKDPVVLRTYGKVLEEEENYPKAIQVINRVIDIADEDEDYEWLEEVVKECLGVRFDYGESATVTIVNENGQVYTMGNNVLGALGTTQNLGIDSVSDVLAPADFPGTAQSVYAFGSNSAVVDENGTLWLAGSNRSGQKALGSTQMIAASGWSEAASVGRVVKAAGVDSTLFALTDDGALWVVGQNSGFVPGSAWLDEWTQITGYGLILDIQSCQNTICFLSDNGRIYRADSYRVDDMIVTNASWKYSAHNAGIFTFNNSCMYWYSLDGSLESDGYNILYPETWNQLDADGYQTGIRPPFDVRGMAALGRSIYLLSSEGELYYVCDGTVSQIETSGTVASIYSTEMSCVAELADGGYLLYDENGSRK